ncbi:MAG: nucleotidyl transferase AbiEii/AbiGii toxin family protein [Clostridiaceae bacterium]|jgi:predicted nucleotidyltransferase component of viral defense system|nr:nucleotidyl transferase AbiEii/AbiGii toxin family protein [Clostridiaceae bacterium]
MIRTSRQLKDLIRNLSKNNRSDAQVLMRNYMMERLLERISISKYRDNFILKGGMLIAAIVGLDARSTMDMDATVKGMQVEAEKILSVMADILSVPLDDGVEFHINQISDIMDEAEYSGMRISMEALFDGVRTPLKIDISTGDTITPREIRYCFNLMFENRSIEIWAYNLETVLSEKLETVIARDITNTRMRDFYDIHILMKLHGGSLNPDDFRVALISILKKRGSEHLAAQARAIFEDLENSSVMQRLWSLYQKKFIYAQDLSWVEVMGSVNALFEIGKDIKK